MNNFRKDRKRKGRVSARLRRLTVFVLTAALLLSLSGCGSTEWEYHPITDVNNLEGRRVAVNMAWEADFLLSGRTDLTVVRYDSFADIILALKYNKVDAFAVDTLVWKLFKINSSGLSRVEPACGTVGYSIYLKADREDILQEFNEFLVGYRESEEYADHLRRLDEFDGYEYVGPEIPLTGTGEVLKVALLTDGYPRSYAEPGEEPTGYDVEALKYFANEKNYQLDFSPTNYDDAIYGLQGGVYDLAVGYLSNIYQKEIEAVGLLVSDAMDVTPIYFVEKTKEDISVDLDAVE